MKGRETELLEVLIAKDSPKIPTDISNDGIDETFVSLPAESFSGGSKASVKRGILKKGPALRRASSMTSGAPPGNSHTFRNRCSFLMLLLPVR